jgi:hypothetical protein
MILEEQALLDANPPAGDEVIEEVIEETDELVDEIKALEVETGKRYTELLGRIEVCQTTLEILSSQERTQVESPMLTQIVAQLSTLQTEVVNLRLSVDLQSRLPELRESIIETPTAYASLNPADPIEEDVQDSIENPTPPTPTKRRWA